MTELNVVLSLVTCLGKCARITVRKRLAIWRNYAVSALQETYTFPRNTHMLPGCLQIYDVRVSENGKSQVANWPFEKWTTPAAAGEQQQSIFHSVICEHVCAGGRNGKMLSPCNSALSRPSFFQRIWHSELNRQHS